MEVSMITPFWLLGVSLAWLAYEEWDARND